MSKNIAELLQEFREAAEGTGNPLAKRANTAHDKMHATYKQLRETPAGRAGIITLMDDVNPHVKCAAAARSLAWAPEKAHAALVALRDSKGACSFDAEIILEEFAKGRLSFEY